MSRAVRAEGQDGCPKRQARGQAHAWADRRNLGFTGQPDELTPSHAADTWSYSVVSGVGLGSGEQVLVAGPTTGSTWAVLPQWRS